MVWKAVSMRERARVSDWSDYAVLEQSQEHPRHAAQFSVKLEMKINELDLCRTEQQQQQNYVDVLSVAFLPATV